MSCCSIAFTFFPSALYFLHTSPDPIIVRPGRSIVHSVCISLVDAILVRAKHDGLTTLPWYGCNDGALLKVVAEGICCSVHSARCGDNILYSLQKPGRGLRAIGGVIVAVLEFREGLEVGLQRVGAQQFEQRGNTGLVRDSRRECDRGNCLLNGCRGWCYEVLGYVDEVFALLSEVTLRKIIPCEEYATHGKKLKFLIICNLSDVCR